MPNPISLSHFAFAYGRPENTAVLKAEPADFQVDEHIAYTLSGEGEHLWVWVQKIGQNTDWVAKQIASWAGITAKEMGVAGKKDRQAITRQWMSLHLPGKQAPDIGSLDVPGVTLLKAMRHHRKLQTGGLSGNRFTLVLREINGNLDQIETRLQKIAGKGVPNYFGEQRFGNDFQNLAKATALFQGQIKSPKRHQKSLYISAARSWIFNEILSQRVRQGTWNRAISGDVFQLEGSQKWFADDSDPSLSKRVEEKGLHPTGALTGRGVLPSQSDAFQVEQAVLEKHPFWQAGLEKLGLKQERRALRVLPKEMHWEWLDQQTLSVGFDLPAGSYATMVMRELFEVKLED
ncbi:MAG: tRNA pseudouridine(13) synthase TruD [Hydrogenovibrio crunogenus]|uniref:tRNA pseudouridine synthase D n=1 Tax=Hydrogenovibrio crunogenus (strain DSM 25203 / XCL-2) TaxID=317025 RepID=TRUD_HYDCU|nr:RecName: Full=tRNA pseudouridine synthase D; AltName: Full=tRNA pseudouridine(13) synthase; AltName: Full=tRNA pseudouridylate synthase D; AltName: Full=tRNA-uridine isomerase D [Hydrogenovibrio crunogenus XCL-2]MBD3611360.1 tRNA pseudouridine(13) synthase TruD [Hydrogenovibrio crunogenus]